MSKPPVIIEGGQPIRCNQSDTKPSLEKTLPDKLTTGQGLQPAGQFSFGDYLRCGAIARFSPIMEDVKRFADQGGQVLGICNGFQILTNIIIPLCKPGIIIGSIFVITVVMGDFLTIGIMGGQQIASIGKIIQVEMSYLQLPAAAANAVILLFITLLLIWTMTKFIDIRKEL